MRDRSLGLFLVVLFGAGGITILVLIWAQPVALPGRVFATLVAAAGFIWVLTRLPFLAPALRRGSPKKPR
ncbi:hypothetical protein ACFLS8_04280 [Chloroflexota bacterium]